MTKETVRYPDPVVAAVEEVIEDGTFESKSEFYRFSAEYVLHSILPEYEPETYDFEEILEELVDERGFEGGVDTPLGEEGAFLEAVVTVRRHGLRGEYEAAEAFIDRAFGAGDVEAVILEELLASHRE